MDFLRSIVVAILLKTLKEMKNFTDLKSHTSRDQSELFVQ